MRPEKKRAFPLASNSSTDPDLFTVARLGRPHGLDGFLGLYVDEQNLTHFQPGSTVRVADDELTVREIRRADRGFQVAFDEVTDRAAAEHFRGLDVMVSEHRRLDEDEYWPDDLIGLPVFDAEGHAVGEVTEVLFGAAQDRLVITRADHSFEVPFVDELVPLVDVEVGRIQLAEIPGLIEP